jgi:hypothetical protein
MHQDGLSCRSFNGEMHQGTHVNTCFVYNAQETDAKCRRLCVNESTCVEELSRSFKFLPSY